MKQGRLFNFNNKICKDLTTPILASLMKPRNIINLIQVLIEAAWSRRIRSQHHSKCNQSCSSISWCRTLRRPTRIKRVLVSLWASWKKLTRISSSDHKMLKCNVTQRWQQPSDPNKDLESVEVIRVTILLCNNTIHLNQDQLAPWNNPRFSLCGTPITKTLELSQEQSNFCHIIVALRIWASTIRLLENVTNSLINEAAQKIRIIIT